MMGDLQITKRFIIIGFCAILIFCNIYPVLMVSVSDKTSVNLTVPLPVDMVLEESIFRRSSIRQYTASPISDEELSTILWAAYGYRDDGRRTISGINGMFGVRIYVLKKNNGGFFDVYLFEPLNNSLVYYKEYKNFLFGQYRAPVYLGVVWNRSVTSEENLVGVVVGEIGQNVQLITNALGLGSVINVDTIVYNYTTYSLARIGLPPNETPMIIIPIGHPKYECDFKYRPWYISLLPRIRYSKMSLSDAINSRLISDTFTGSLSRHELSQILWSSYGYSYFLDKTDDNYQYHIYRHRTIPSAHGFYPLTIYVIMKSGVFEYYPNILTSYTPDPYVDRTGLPILSYMKKVINGDHREELAQICSRPALTTAPLIIIPTLALSRPRQNDPLWLWFYEAGSSAHNVQLISTALNLSTNVYPITKIEDLCSMLNIDSSQYLPLTLIPVGK